MMKGNPSRQKKAVIFSIATIIILAALLGFARVYYHSIVAVQESNADTIYGGQMQYFEDDIFQNIYTDLMETTVNPIQRSSSTVTLNFTQQLNDSDNNYAQYFSDYETFIEKNYSGNNYNFTLAGFDNSFNITPYDIMYTVDDGRLYIYTADIDNLRNITVKVTVDTDLVKTLASSPDDDKNDANKVPIFIYYYRPDGVTLIDSLTLREQNPYENNDPFRQTFKDVPNQDVIEINTEYGTYNGVAGVLQVFLHNANTDYNIAGNASIILNYNQGTPVIVFGGDLTIDSVIHGLTRTFTHIIERE